MQKQLWAFVVCALASGSLNSVTASTPVAKTAEGNSERIIEVALSDMPIPTAVCFSVIVKTPIDTRVARNGDVIQAALKEDLQIEDQIVAPAGSILVGHLEEVTSRRPLYKGMRAAEPRLYIGNRKSIRLLFDRILTDQKEICIVGIASKQKINVIAGGAMRVLVVGADGELEPSEHIIRSGRKLLAAAMPRSARAEHHNEKLSDADLDSGDELLVQAHSPYESVKVSER